MAKTPDHKDILGQDVVVGSIVVVPTGTRNMAVCKVTKVSPKMVTVERIDGNSRSTISRLRYPGDICVIEQLPETALFLLKN